MIKVHFSWSWQCMTLNHGDELINLLLSCIQPHQLRIADFQPYQGQGFGHFRSIFGVLSMYHESKVPKPGVRLRWLLFSPHCSHSLETMQQNEPDYNFIIPHRDPLRCSVGALAIHLHYMFDQEGLCSRVEGWNWSQASSWRKVGSL